MRTTLLFSILLVQGCSFRGPVLETRDGGPDARVVDSDAGADGSTEDSGLLDDGGAMRDCFTLPPSFGGALCGTASDPCELRANVLVDGPHFRNDAPSISVDASNVATIVYSVAEGGYQGYLADGDGAFAPEALPFPVATVSTAQHGGALLALTDDGAFGMTLRRRSGESFSTVGTRLGTSGASGMVVDDGGCAHVAYGRESGEIAYAAWLGDDWLETSLTSGGASSPFAAIAIGPDPGTREAMLHFAYRYADASGAGVWWQLAPGARELVPGSETTSAISLAPVRMRVLGQEPHVLFRSDGTGDVVYARRAETGWVSAILATDTGESCPAPTAPDQSCDYRRTWHRVVDLVVSGSGDVRIFYGEITGEGHLTSTCSGGPGPTMTCTWNGAPTFTGRLLMAIPASAAPAVVSDAIAPLSGTATLDALGRIHLALYTLEPSGDDPATRYVLLSGSAPTCRPDRVAFPAGGSLEEGQLCDDVFVCVPDAAGAARVMGASSSFVCAPDAACGDGYRCQYREGGTGGGPSILDGAEVAEICAVTVLEPPPESITCMIYL